jgi:3-phosphoshikimate 1-carboxyvinyltransferase
MKVDIFPSDLEGTAQAPGSKSAAQRMVACALLAKGESVISDFPWNNDCRSALLVIQALGAVVSVKGNELIIKGGFPQAFHAGIRNPKTKIHCGESGLAARMFTPIAALTDKQILIEGEGTLLTRTFHDFEHILPALGVNFNSNEGFLPLVVQGPLNHGELTMDASVSSQFLTGLLMALPKASGESIITVKDLKSKPYIELTLQVLEMFGVKIKHRNLEKFHIKPSLFVPQKLTVPGDWSGAAFLLVAGALCASDGLRVTNLSNTSAQADRAIISALQSAGVYLEILENEIVVKASEINAFEFDANDCPDLFPPLAALAAFANGVSTIYGIKRLVHKESNRAKALQQEFAKANVRIMLRDDEMKIYPASVTRAVINSHNDHRIAMAAAILGLAGDRVSIRNAEAVNKSYPEFFDVIAKLGGKVKQTALAL